MWINSEFEWSGRDPQSSSQSVWTQTGLNSFSTCSGTRQGQHPSREDGRSQSWQTWLFQIHLSRMISQRVSRWHNSAGSLRFSKTTLHISKADTEIYINRTLKAPGIKGLFLCFQQTPSSKMPTCSTAGWEIKDLKFRRLKKTLAFRRYISTESLTFSKSSHEGKKVFRFH